MKEENGKLCIVPFKYIFFQFFCYTKHYMTTVANAVSKPPSSKPASERFYEFDVLRAISVLYITCFFHIQEMWLFKANEGLTLITAQVVLCIFCFLSGLMYGLRYKFNNSRDVSQFFRKRFWRLYPLYAAALIIFLILGKLDITTFLYSLFLLNIPLNIPLLTLWFVSLITIFYLLIPIYLTNPSDIRTCVVTLAILAVLFILKYTLHIIDDRLINFLIPFAFGILLAQVEKLKSFFLRPKVVPTLLCFAIFVVIAIFGMKYHIHDSSKLDRILIISAFLSSLPMAILLSQQLLRILPVKIITFVSGASFMLYLVHRIVYFIGRKLYTPPIYSLQSQLYLLFVLIPIAIVTSHYTQKGYDRLFEKRS